MVNINQKHKPCSEKERGLRLLLGPIGVRLRKFSYYRQFNSSKQRLKLPTNMSFQNQPPSTITSSQTRQLINSTT